MAQKLSQRTLGLIRKVFAREKEARRELGPRRPYFDPSGRDFNLMSLFGYDVIGDYMRLDHDLFTRFFDYEEMDEYPDLNSVLDIYADDASQIDDERKVTVWIESKNSDVEREGNAMLARCKAEEQSWEILRSLCKYGNDYEELLVNDSGVQGLAFMPPATVRRIDGARGENLGFVQSYAGDFTVDPTQFGDLLNNPGMQVGGETAIAFEDWRVVHSRLRGRYRAAMYGHSVYDPARWIWKRLMLLEDATLIYKLTRSPSRFAFYIDTGRLQGEEALAYTNRIAQLYKKRKFVNPKTNQLDMAYNPLSVDEDFFLPMSEGGRGTKIDLLNGPTFQSMEDVEYFLKKLYAATKVPRAYLGYSEDIAAKATLSQQDIRFARTVLRVQREHRNMWRRVYEVDLAARNVDPDYVEFDVGMMTPSALFELGNMELRKARAELGREMRDLNFSMYWVMEKVMGLTDREIKNIVRQDREEKIENAKYEAEVQRALQLGAEGQPVLAVSEPGKPIPAIPLPSAAADAASAEVAMAGTGDKMPIRGLLPSGFKGESRRHPRGIIELPIHHRFGRSGRSGRVNNEITERELLRGRSSDEKVANLELERALRNNPRLTARLEEVRQLVREISYARKTG